MSTVDPHAFPRETRREFVAKTLMLGAAAMLAPDGMSAESAPGQRRDASGVASGVASTVLCVFSEAQPAASAAAFVQSREAIKRCVSALSCGNGGRRGERASAATIQSATTRNR